MLYYKGLKKEKAGRSKAISNNYVFKVAAFAKLIEMRLFN